MAVADGTILCHIMSITSIATTVATTLEGATAKLDLRGAAEPDTKVLGRPGPDYPYARFLPSYDQNLKLPPLEPFEHVDPGHAALKDLDPRSFLAGAEIDDLTPKFGSEVRGTQLSQLDGRGKRSACDRTPVRTRRLLMLQKSTGALCCAKRRCCFS